MTRTFVDAGVLIHASSGKRSHWREAIAVLADPDREFVSSALLRLEVLPKAVYNQRKDEAGFYRTFFGAVVEHLDSIDSIAKAAEREMKTHGLGTVDSFHIAAAVKLGVDEFVTSEKAGKSIFRTKSVKVVSIR